MKLWEVIKELTEDHKRQFLFDESELNLVGIKGGSFVWVAENKQRAVAISSRMLGDFWTKVIPPVDWNEALEHMRNGGKAKFTGSKDTFWWRGCFRHTMSDSSEGYASLNSAMLDSKEWELL